MNYFPPALWRTDSEPTVPVTDAPTAPTLKGIGGWLALLAIGVTLTPFKAASSVIMTADYWANEVSKSAAVMRPIMADMRIFSVATMLLITIAWIVAAVMFYRRSRRFPRWFIALSFATALASIAIDINCVFVFALYLSKPLSTVFMVMVNEPIFGKEISDAIVGLIYASVWSAYLLRSKRVANTFVR